MLAPRWVGFHPGPYLRGEPDKRNYSGYFLAEQHVRGLSRWMACTLGQRFSEDNAEQACDSSGQGPTRIVEFNGVGNLFAPIRSHHAFVRERLWNMTKPSHRPPPRPYSGRFIAMHVRRGDITRQGFTPGELQKAHQYTPLSWFVSMARAVRQVPVLRQVPIVVFTDGSPDEVGELCAVEGVRLHQRQAAITDIWTLAEADLLFASGCSTFSMWASYLGRMPTLYAPGKIEQRVQMENAAELEVAAGSPLPPEALQRFD